MKGVFNMTNLEKAIAERDEFLKVNPDLQEYQNTIDTILDKTPECQRIEVLSIMITGKLIELHDKLREISAIIQNE